MRYVPRQPRDDVNVSKAHPLAEAGTLFVGLGVAFTLIAVALFFLVDMALLYVSPEKEAELFASWLPEHIELASLDDGENDARLEALQQLIDRLAKHWPDSPYSFRVAIEASESLNAMAYPGGLIVITAGLLDSVASENELAFVLGHELGHYKNRDHIRGLGRGVVLMIVLTAISGNNVELGTTIGTATLRSFGRRQESAADEFGLTIVHKEYGHVADAWVFFDRVRQQQGGAAMFDKYLSTHPIPQDRIDDILEIAASRGWLVQGGVTHAEWLSTEP